MKSSQHLEILNFIIFTSYQHQHQKFSILKVSNLIGNSAFIPSSSEREQSVAATTLKILYFQKPLRFASVGASLKFYFMLVCVSGEIFMYSFLHAIATATECCCCCCLNKWKFNKIILKHDAILHIPQLQNHHMC